MLEYFDGWLYWVFFIIPLLVLTSAFFDLSDKVADSAFARKAKLKVVVFDVIVVMLLITIFTPLKVSVHFDVDIVEDEHLKLQKQADDTKDVVSVLENTNILVFDTSKAGH